MTVSKTEKHRLHGGSHLHNYVYKALVILICGVMLLFLMEYARSSKCFSAPGTYVQYNQHQKKMDMKIPAYKNSQEIDENENNDHYKRAIEKFGASSVTPTEDGTLINYTTTPYQEDIIQHKEIQDDASPKITPQNERQQLLREFCREEKQRMKTEMQLSNIAYNDAHGILYCIVPKVACTNWKRVLMVLEGKVNESLAVKRKEQVHKIVYPNFQTLKDDLEKTWRKNLYYSFMFVRHPFERLLSAYRNKFADPYNPTFQRLYGPKILKMFRPNLRKDEYNDGRNVTFKEFLDYIIVMHTKSGTLALNEHWQVIHSLCSPCTMKYNFIGKMETLAEDTNTVLKEAGIDNIVQFPVNETDKYQTRTKEIMKEFFSEIPKETINKLYHIYKYDFLAFGYEIPDYLQ